MSSHPNILQTAAFILLAPLVGMAVAFVISLWFLFSFRKDILPRFISLGMILLVGWLVYTQLQTNPQVLAKNTHYESYTAQLIFYTQNFKWILLGFILFIMAFFTFWLNTLNAHQSNIWFKRLQLVSSAAFRPSLGLRERE